MFGAAHIARAADTHRAWRETGGPSADAPGFAKAATTAEIEAQGGVLAGRHVGTAAAEADTGLLMRVRRV